MLPPVLYAAIIFRVLALINIAAQRKASAARRVRTKTRDASPKQACETRIFCKVKAIEGLRGGVPVGTPRK